MSTIHLQNLVKKFGDFTALKTFDLEIADGEFMALLGPSGCGKSTTMNMIAGMEEPTEGRILFGERDMAGVPMGRRGVGFVFQNYAIFTHMTVRQNLSYGPRMRGAPKPEIDRRVGAIAELLQLTPLLDRKADRLSVNILQRVAIGRSAIMEPAIFLLDEPLSNVDAAFRAVMRTELKHLQRQFRQTMVYVTHDQLEAMTMADRIAVMDHGVLQQVGTPIEVYNNPANVFVARFIGAPGMNLLKGRPAESDRGLVIDLGPLGATPPLPDDLAAAGRQQSGEILYGFRPEQTAIAPDGKGLAMPVTFVERIGARTIVHLGEGGTAVKAVFNNDVGLSIGETAIVAPNAASVRLFDAASGNDPGELTMAEIAFRNVTKRYGATVAVDDASFVVEDNEFFCFFGPPLSGKSTILRLILGLETPDSGEILIGGKPANQISPAARNVAMVFQNLALFPHMSARDNVRFPLVERRVPEAEIGKRVADVAAKLHIGHILHKPPAQLSGGERQRVAIARALVRDPVAYLMDDPISALDARLREETRVELKRIQRELGRTLIYVTHDQEEAMSVADRMAILEHGRIRQVGAPVEIYDHPASIYVARLLGSPMMNILKSVRGDGGVEAADGAIRIADAAAPAEAVEIGLRPEDVKVRSWPEGGIGRPAKVFEVEPLGGYTVVTLDAEQSRLRALMRGLPEIKPETLVALSCEPGRVHYFASGGAALAR